MTWIFLLVATSAFGSPPQADLALAPGDQVMVPAPSGQKITVGNGRLVKVEDLGHTIRLIGKTKGETLLTVGDKSFRVHVLSTQRLAAYRAISKITADMMGLSIALEGDDVVVKGELLRFQDWLEIKKQIDGQWGYRFSARLSQAVASEASQFFTSYLRSLDLPAPVLHFDPSASADIPDSVRNLEPKYKTALSPFGIAVDVVANLVSPEPMIRVKIVVAEIKRKNLTNFGIQWPDSINAQLVSGKVQFDSPQWTLQALESRGLGKVLAAPNLLCRSGKQASFLAGGEIPIKIISSFTGSVTWKQYGVLLKINPVADFAGHMSVGIQTEVSMIDPSETVDGLPGFLTNRIETHFDLKKSRTIALSGLIKHEWTSTISGLPWLNHIPILGALFSSQDYLNQQSELVIFVTPQVITDEGTP